MTEEQTQTQPEMTEEEKKKAEEKKKQEEAAAAGNAEASQGATENAAQ